VRRFLSLIKRAIRKADELFFRFILLGISRNLKLTIRDERWCYPKDAVAKRSSRRRFFKYAAGRNIVVFGLDGIAIDFMDKYKDKFQYEAIYIINNPKGIKTFRGIPVYNAEDFTGDKHENCAYLVTSSWYANSYIDILKNNGRTHYYAYVVMECRRFFTLIRRPIIRFRYSFLRPFLKRDGLFVNYIWFHIKAVLRVCRIPGFYKSRYAKIKKVKNIHKGERCFIVATGPSLRIEDVELLKNEITFSVNGTFRLFEKTDWRPTYYALQDHNVCLDYSNRYGNVDFDSFCIKRIFFAYQLEKILRKNPYTRKAHFIPCSYLNDFTSGQRKKFYYSENMLWGLYSAQTVVNFCMQIAQYMGFKEIYLLGVDCDYVTNGQHFSDEKSPNLKSYTQLFDAQARLIKVFGWMKNELEARGVMVYNATRGGALEVFERVTLEDVIAS